jgi:large subunit ribosomal protein L19
MSSALIQAQSAAFKKARPDIRPGFTVRVHEKIQEGEKERVQIFEGLVISLHKGHGPADSTMTVRRIVSGVGVEKIFPINSPNVEKIEVKKVAKVRRAKLFFLRGRHGKSARMNERFTTAGEFAIPGEDVPAETVETVESAE